MTDSVTNISSSSITVNPKIIFIIGAGASYDYGFPLGSELKNQIIELWQNPPSGVNYTQDFDDPKNELPFGVSKALLTKWAQQLKLSSSIDAFCFNNQNSDENKTIKKVAKICIARILNNPMKNFEQQSFTKDWIAQLFSRIIEFNDSPQSLKAENIWFLDFNYDTTIESRLETYYKMFSENSNIHLAKFFKNINVKHVYGTLGPLPVEDNESNRERSTREIKLMGERSQNEQIPGGYSEIIINAKMLIFLGFGFHAFNMRFIGLPENASQGIFSGKIVASTSIDLDLERVARIYQIHSGSFSKRGNGDCTDTLAHLDSTIRNLLV